MILSIYNLRKNKEIYNNGKQFCFICWKGLQKNREIWETDGYFHYLGGNGLLGTST